MLIEQHFSLRATFQTNLDMLFYHSVHGLFFVFFCLVISLVVVVVVFLKIK